MDNLKHKAATGIIWKFLDQGGTQLLQVISGIYIARILSPDDYGLIGMMAIFLGISYVFIDSGFRSTLLQRGNNVSLDDYNTVFYFNTVVSLFFYLLIYFTAPFISEFYQESRLLLVARVIGLNIVILALGSIPQLIFEKKINFKTISKINLTATILSVTSGIVLAVTGFGVWALVSMFLVESLVKTTLLWVLNKWRPRFSFSRDSFKSLFQSGSKLLLSSIVWQVGQNSFSMVIGKFFTITDVGFYDQARKFQQRTGEIITLSIQGVLFPVQSLIKDDLPRFKNAIRTNVKLTTFIALPAIFGFIAIAEPFVLIALGDKWGPSITYMQLLSIGGIFFVISYSINSMLLPLGKFNFILRLSIFTNLMLIVIIILTIVTKSSINILILGKIIHELLILIVSVIFAYKFIKYTTWEILKDVFPSIANSFLMGCFVVTLRLIFGINLPVILSQIVVGIISYWILSYFSNKKTYLEVRKFILNKIQKELLHY